MKKGSLFLGILFMLTAVGTAAWGGWLENVVERAGQRAAERVIDRAARESSDAAYDKTKEGIKNGDRNRSRDDEDSDSRRGDDSGSRGSGGGESAGDSAPPANGQVYSNRFDFIAGDKVILFEDFSDTPPGDYPSRWKHSGGSVEVVEYQGQHWLKSLGEGQKGNMKESWAFMRVDLNKELPDKFTVEFDIPATANIGLSLPGKYWATGEDSVSINPEMVEMYWGHARNNSVDRAKGPLRHVSVAVSGTNVKVYFDGQRVLLAPEGVRREKTKIRTIGFVFPSSGKLRQDLMVTNIRLAEGGKDYAKELVSGRIITHGITFDTGSAVLKPQSGPTLWKIHKLLDENADLKFEIQGHTDNVGSSSSNQRLSEDRAAAVRDWLVSQGIDGGRLTTKGFGDTKPMSSNDSPEGRAENRRVEFVKL